MEEKNNYVVITVSSVMRRDREKRSVFRAFSLEPLHIIRKTSFQIVLAIVINLCPPPKA